MEKISNEILDADEKITDNNNELKYVNCSKFINLAILGVSATLVATTNIKFGINPTSCLVSAIGIGAGSFSAHNFKKRNNESRNLNTMINNLNEYKAKLLRDKKKQECSKAIGSRRNVVDVKTSNELVDEYFNSKQFRK